MKNAPGNFPKYFAVVDIEAKRATLGADTDLVLSGKVDECRRSVANRIVEGTPNDFPIVLVEAENGFAISGTALDDKLVAKDKGRRRDSVSRHAGMIPDYDIFRPNDFAAGRIEASQFAHCAEDVQLAVVKSGCGARTFFAEIFLKSVGPGASP